MPNYYGCVQFVPKWSDVKGKLELGHTLYIQNQSFYYFTSTLRKVTDKGTYLLFETSSGSLYMLEPILGLKEDFLKKRGIK